MTIALGKLFALEFALEAAGSDVLLAMGVHHG
jgi:hypothetical protein